MLQEIKLPSAMDGIEYDAFYGDSNLRVIWPDSWIERKESKLKVVAQMHKRELYFLTADATKIKKGQSFTMFYCGHGSENPFYYFCESSEFFKNNRSNNSIFQYFYDVESLNRDDMYSDLVELFDKAAIDRNEISTVDVPFYGWKSRNETPDAVKNGKIQLFSIQVTIEYGWNDYENPVNITL
jgi:hypothetical protein